MEPLVEWQPISTAPFNQKVLIYSPDYGYIDVAEQWPNGAWWEADDYQHDPTHWMPLPAPPK